LERDLRRSRSAIAPVGSAVVSSAQSEGPIVWGRMATSALILFAGDRLSVSSWRMTLSSRVGSFELQAYGQPQGDRRFRKKSGSALLGLKTTRLIQLRHRWLKIFSAQKYCSFLSKA
jgi:hypothetical protein